MLVYILAVLVGTGSVGLYIAAFFYPEIHRKPDFIWSGVGLFYALFLWLYADGVTGGILVGQTTSVALLSWFAWQTIKLRRQIAPLERQATVTAAKPTAPKSAKTAAERLAKVTKAEPPNPPTTPQNSAKPPTVAPSASAARAQNPGTTTRTIDRSPNPSVPTTPAKPDPAPPNSAPRNPARTGTPTTPVKSANPTQPTPPPSSTVPSNPRATTPTTPIADTPVNRPPASPDPLSLIPTPVSQIQQPERQNTAAQTDKSTIDRHADAIGSEDTGAWIKLEPIKPVSAPSEPLGTAMQPPQAKDRPEPSSPLPKTGDLDALLDEIETTVRPESNLNTSRLRTADD